MSEAYQGIGGSWGGLQKRESPDFRFPGVGTSAASVVPLLMASGRVKFLWIYML